MSPRFYGLVILAALGIVRGCIVPAPAGAQADDPLVAVVAQLTAHEAGVDSLADADGIYAVLVHGAERHGITPVQYAHRYSPRFFAGTSARPWALDLDASCARPHGFVGRWDAPRALGARSGAASRHDACVALFEHVRVLVQAPPVYAATAWGSIADAARRRAQGCDWITVPVGAARNVFMRALRCPGGV